MTLKNKFFKILFYQKLFILYLIGVFILTNMVTLEAINIINKNYTSIFNWLKNELVLLFLILFLFIHLYTIYKNCLHVISPEISIFNLIGLSKHEILMKINKIFIFCTILIFLFFSSLNWSIIITNYGV